MADESINAPIGDFEDERILMLFEFPQAKENKQIQNILKEARTILDMGSGITGASVKQLLTICPNAEKIITVDLAFTTNLGSPPGKINHQHHETNISTYLKEGKDEVDVVCFAHVPGYNPGPEDYKNLDRLVKERGIIIQVGDTVLDEDEMKKYFKLAVDIAPTKKGDYPQYHRIWVKKTVSVNSKQ